VPAPADLARDRLIVFHASRAAVVVVTVVVVGRSTLRVALIGTRALCRCAGRYLE
jgi:hypothetical protein